MIARRWAAHGTPGLGRVCVLCPRAEKRRVAGAGGVGLGRGGRGGVWLLASRDFQAHFRPTAARARVSATSLIWRTCGCVRLHNPNAAVTCRPCAVPGPFPEMFTSSTPELPITRRAAQPAFWSSPLPVPRGRASPSPRACPRSLSRSVSTRISHSVGAQCTRAYPASVHDARLAHGTSGQVRATVRACYRAGPRTRYRYRRRIDRRDNSGRAYRTSALRRPHMANSFHVLVPPLPVFPLTLPPLLPTL